MGVESPKGTKFYIEKGYKPVTINLPPGVHEQLKKLARKEERSLQITARRIITNHIKNVRKA